MVSRIMFSGDIERKAEEDLIKLLIYKEPKPHQLNYSPYILRRVNESLNVQGQTIGLGFLSEKEIIDSYWSNIELPLQNDLNMRIIFGTNIGCYNEIVLLIKNNQIRKKINLELDDISKLKPKNPLVYRFRTTIKDNYIDNICEQIRVLAVEKELKIHTDIFYLEKEIIEVENTKFQWISTEQLKFKCYRCNFCEFPSNYAVNPIPNISHEGGMVTFNNRICFPSNLPTVTSDEIQKISLRTGESLNEFCRPIFGLIEKDGQCFDITFGLNQNNGICVFQDVEKRECRIRDISPLNCKSYPFLINCVKDNFIEMDVDFSCPGVGTGKAIDKKKLSKEYSLRLKKSTKKDIYKLEDLKEIWSEIIPYVDKERINEDEIEYAQKVFLKD
ncbi:MAG: YkgJ family cysteine cluster protein [Candidatus Heimdallarchaeota archaeon]|nr:YkgJ family cysteine cluster protein [Candidatus Heimdallarchaeota archaeon]MCK4954649.1 YkgJ family cysteine cluster protein [Candidatus Heimdallarchaeota archaeon]